MGGSSKDCQLIVFKVLCTQQTSGMWKGYMSLLLMKRTPRLIQIINLTDQCQLILPVYAMQIYGRNKSSHPNVEAWDPS